MVHTREQAMNLVSCLRRLYLTMLESGVQEFLRTEGRVDIDEFAHEACNFNGLGLFLNLDKEVNNKVRHLFINILPPEVSQQLIDGEYSIDKLLLSWPVGHLDSCPPKIVHGKIATTELIAGVGNYEDTFANPPVPSPKTLAECYAKENYDVDDC